MAARFEMGEPGGGDAEWDPANAILSLDKYPQESIPIPEFDQAVLRQYETDIPKHNRRKLLEIMDKNKDGVISYPEFSKVMLDLSRRQFLVRLAASSVVPRNADQDPDYYVNHYSCKPPPIFMPVISIAQVVLFIIYAVDMGERLKVTVTFQGGTPFYSPLIYNPYRRYEAWRYLSYMFLHAGYYHIIFNLLVQLLVGIPLEMVHTFWRVGIIYLLGVIGGSLAHSVSDQRSFLLGASGGCYALLGAHLANMITNWKEMSHDWTKERKIYRLMMSAPVRLIIWLVLVGGDMGVAIYGRFFADKQSQVGLAAHVGGLLCGLLIGIPILKNINLLSWERIAYLICIGIYVVLLAFTILFNIFFTGFPASDTSPLPGQRNIAA